MDFRPMSPEEVERTVQFLLHSQAQFESNFARLSEKTDALSDKTNRIAEGLLGLTALANQSERKVQDLAQSVGVVRDGLVALTGIVGRIEERAEQREERLGRRLDALLASSLKTEKKRRGKSRSSGTRRRP